MSFDRVYIRTTRFEKGDKVVFLRPMENYPTCGVERGETGEIVASEEEYLSVRLDKYREKLEEWNNQFHIYKRHEPNKNLGKIVAKGIALPGSGEHIVLSEYQ